MNLGMQYDDSAALAAVQTVRPAIQQAMHATADDASSLWQLLMQRYPPPIAGRIMTRLDGSSYMTKGYRRTDTLRRSWMKSVSVEGMNVIGEAKSAGNIAPYNVYVQMEGVQAWMHQGFWETESSVIERTSGQVAQMAQRRLNDALRTVR